MSVIAGLGGILFAASLAYLIFFYGIVLGRSDAPGARPALASIVINAGLFALFATHHSLFARTALKQRVRRVLPRGERTLYVWIASALLVAVCSLWQHVPGALYDVDGIARVLFYGVQLTGAILVLRAARVVDPLELSGIRQATHRDRPAELKIVGPYRFVRHPIYLGWILAVFATPTMTMDRFVFATITSAYLIVAIPWEERTLAGLHGDEYRAYQRTVRWRLIPGLW